MYQAATSMIPRLGPESYYDPGTYQADVARLRQTTWHLVGATSQLALPGDYLALEILGTPVLVRNFDNQLVAFRNVCAHRHCRLVDLGGGRSNELTCRYHGWQYGSDGLTRRIPGARNFPKFDRHCHRLESFTVETVGQLVFVKLAECGMSLCEWLGPWQQTLERCSSAGNWKLNLMDRLTYEANWKIPVEGSLESYHLDQVHAATFGSDPGEEASRHSIDARGTSFETEARGNGLAQWLEEASIRWLTGDFDRCYRHMHLFPNLMVSLTDAITLVYQIEPLAAERCVMTVVGLGRLPVGRDPLRRLWAWGMRRASARIATKVLMEDAKIFPVAHAGKRGAIDHGIFGRCEERLDAFHKHWSQSLAPSHPLTRTGAQPS